MFSIIICRFAWKIMSSDNEIDDILREYRGLRYPTPVIFNEHIYRVILARVNSAQRCDSISLQISRFYIGITAFDHMLSRFRRSDVDTIGIDGQFLTLYLKNKSTLQFMCDAGIIEEIRHEIQSDHHKG